MCCVGQSSSGTLSPYWNSHNLPKSYYYLPFCNWWAYARSINEIQELMQDLMARTSPAFGWEMSHGNDGLLLQSHGGCLQGYPWPRTTERDPEPPLPARPISSWSRSLGMSRREQGKLEANLPISTTFLSTPTLQSAVNQEGWSEGTMRTGRGPASLLPVFCRGHWKF